MNTQTQQPLHKAFSLARVSAIASNTLLELVRQKVFYFLLIFALVLIGASFFADFLHPDLRFKILKDTSLGAMSIFTWLLATLTSAMLLPKDIEDRTLYTILAKPVPRFEYLMGKLLGVLIMLAFSVLVMSLMFAAVLFVKQQFAMALDISASKTTDPAVIAEITRGIKAQTFSWSLGAGIIAIYVKAAVFATLTLLISTFASSLVFTIVVSVSSALIGYLVSTAREYWESGAISWLGKGFAIIVALMFPDVKLYDLSDEIMGGNSIPLGILMQTVGMGGLYILVYAWLAYLMFSKKEL